MTFRIKVEVEMTPKELRAERDRKIVELATAESFMTVQEIADQIDGASKTIVNVAFRKYGINRMWTGRPKRKVSA